WHGQVVADIPVAALTHEAPVYDRPASPPKRRAASKASSPSSDDRLKPVPLQQGQISSILRRLLDSPDVASKRWVFRQYDCLVQSNTVVEPGSDAAVLRIKGSRRGLALAVDSNPHACALDPYAGAAATVCEAARNVACA